MKTHNPNKVQDKLIDKVLTLEEFKDKYYGITGTAKRNKLEAGYKKFKSNIAK